MSPDLIFTIANNGILIFWVLLIVAPRWYGTQLAVHSIAVPVILGLAYLWLLYRVWLGGEGAAGTSYFTPLGQIAFPVSPCIVKGMTYEDGHILLLVGLNATVGGSCPSYLLAYQVNFPSMSAVSPLPLSLTLSTAIQGEFLLSYANLEAIVTTNSTEVYIVNTFLNPLVGTVPATYNASLPQPQPGRFIIAPAPTKSPTRTPTKAGSPSTPSTPSTTKNQVASGTQLAPTLASFALAVIVFTV